MNLFLGTSLFWILTWDPGIGPACCNIGSQSECTLKLSENKILLLRKFEWNHSWIGGAWEQSPSEGDLLNILGLASVTSSLIQSLKNITWIGICVWPWRFWTMSHLLIVGFTLLWIGLSHVLLISYQIVVSGVGSYESCLQAQYRHEKHYSWTLACEHCTRASSLTSLWGTPIWGAKDGTWVGCVEGKHPHHCPIVPVSYKLT